METIIYHIASSDFDEVLNDAARVIKDGGLVVFPTETVYGIGANALDSKASKKIYEVKGRPSDNPLIVHLGNKCDLKKYADTDHPDIDALISAFWPGPLTLVLPKKDGIPDNITGGLDTVALRMPSNPISQALIQRSGVPICAPSANISGRPSSTTFDHVYNDLNGKVEMIIDGGKSSVGLESTVLDLTSSTPTVLRPGAITQSMIEHVLQRHIVDASGGVDALEVPKSPGMKYRHYAPKSTVVIVNGTHQMITKFIKKQSNNIAIIGSNELCSQLADYLTFPLGSIHYPKQIAKELFSALRSVDQYDLDTIYVEAFEEKEIGVAIMNRLLRAASHNVMELE